MKYLILSDIHGNLEALQSALSHVEGMKFDKYIVLGDLVGYGASPNEVVNLVREMDPLVVIRGNHDRVACGLADGSDFNHAARDAALWTYEELVPENRDYVSLLPHGPVEVDGLFDIVHGAPWHEDYYIFQWREAYAALQRSDKALIFFGHTHIPIIWTLGDGMIGGQGITDGKYEYPLEKGKRYLINPGSVGQPRDSNPQAGLAILDTDEMKMQFFRIDYNIEGAQKRIRRAGLDRFLAERLAAGR